MIEFTKAISKAEVDSRYLNLKDDFGNRYGVQFPPHGTKLIVVDDQGRKFNATKHHEHQIWGNLRTWYESNKITPGTRIVIKFDSEEKINGNHVVRILIEKIAELEEGKNIDEENYEQKRIEIPIEFERQLESFLEKNLNKLESGLKLYKDDAGNLGRQYPTDIGSIDLLCVNKNGDFVILELKKGRGSDAAVGQIQRYMGWVKENLCKNNENVFGIIITNEFDNKLNYSVAANDKLRIRYYKIHLEFVSEDDIKKNE